MKASLIESLEVENPCYMCMPMGAAFPFKGTAGCMVVMHGSQGCATYIRRHMSEHFREPVDIASSAITEQGAVYGGAANLCRAMDNVKRLYSPEVIGIISTCLSETIGEDLDGIVEEYLRAGHEAGIPIIPVHTPGYGGSHYEGYWAAARAIVERLTHPCQPHSRINVIVPNLSPADIRELRRLMEQMGISATIFPDISITMDAPYSLPYRRIPAGGTPVPEIAAMAGAPATLQLGYYGPDARSPGAFLRDQFGVKLYNMPIPLGLKNTDRLLAVLAGLSGRLIPQELISERGRLLDAMVDAHKVHFEARLALIGDPHQVIAISGICGENGLDARVIAVCASGKTGETLATHLKELVEGECQILADTDYRQILEACRENGVVLAVGPSDAKYLREREGLMLVRHGYPVHDRIGAGRLLSLGYTGSMLFLDRISNALLEKTNDGYYRRIHNLYSPRIMVAGYEGGKS